MAWKISILFIIFSLSAFLNTSEAQNRVEVTQNGNGNSVSINQSDNSQKRSAQNGCNESKPAPESQRAVNKVLVQSADAHQDTLLYQTGIQDNAIATLVEQLLALTASQQGKANRLMITLANDGQSPRDFTVDQNGMENTITARHGNSPSVATITQNGAGNTITINPCDTLK